MSIILRQARLDERAEIEQLIAAAARGLSRADYTDEQIEAAIASVFGVDTDLIVDGTYFVAAAGILVGCGGWSKRKTLFGGDRYSDRESGYLDPDCDAAKIRAFFVHPDWARKGIGRAILQRCELEAQASGFRSVELMATLPGVKLYRACGYTGSDRVAYTISNGVRIEFIPMSKTIVRL